MASHNPQIRPTHPTWCSRPYLISPQTTSSPLIAPGFPNEEREFLSHGADFSQVLLGLHLNPSVGEMIALFLQSLSFHTGGGYNYILQIEAVINQSIPENIKKKVM